MTTKQLHDLLDYIQALTKAGHFAAADELRQLLPKVPPDHRDRGC